MSANTRRRTSTASKPASKGGAPKGNQNARRPSVARHSSIMLDLLDDAAIARIQERYGVNTFGGAARLAIKILGAPDTQVIVQTSAASLFAAQRGVGL